MLRTCLVLFSLFCFDSYLNAEDKPLLNALFTDNMVLQRGIPVPIWGWAAPGKEITVSIKGTQGGAGATSAKATSDADGKWMAKLGPFEAGGPYSVTVSGPAEVTLNNVLIGDVWICSGQSNMEMGIGMAKDAQEEIAKADFPTIRLYTVGKKNVAAPQENLTGQWLMCTPQNIAANGWGGFSAAAYFFGRHLNQELKVPIGLIHTSWGGTIAEAWVGAESLKTMPDFTAAVEGVQAVAAQEKLGTANPEKSTKEWWTKNDPGTAGNWQAVEASSADWKTMKLPQNWEGAGLPDYDGVVWFRREVDIPAELAGKELEVSLGPIDDDDTTWFNGIQIGSTDGWQTPRKYKIPGDKVKSGKAVIAVRVMDTGGGGGIYGDPKLMYVKAEGAAEIALAGDWKYKDSVPLSKCGPPPGKTMNNPNVATVLFNGMIAPLIPYGIKGAIWYQGESNADRAEQYKTLLPLLIKDWRSRFGVGDFPFFIVQIASFMAAVQDPVQPGWAELREAQALTAKNDPHNGLALAIDIGEATDIHPKNKQEVGRRLALNALAIAYGQKIEYSGPVYKSMEVDGAKLKLSFDHLGGGLDAKGGKLQGFAIAGEDKKWEWADAVIEGDLVVLTSAKIAKPVAARYDWANNPAGTLYNKAGLPAVPFRTDP